MSTVELAVLPLEGAAGRALRDLARCTGAAAIAAIDGATLLAERARLQGFLIPKEISAGGGCRLIETADDIVALNLARGADRELLPALLEHTALDPHDDRAVARAMKKRLATAVVARGREMGLAIARVRERRTVSPPITLVNQGINARSLRSRPRVLDLSALWAGPLAAHLLWLAGAEVIKVESLARPDAMRDGQPEFYALLNQGKASVALDLHRTEDRSALVNLIDGADIVVEAARPRALAQLGIDVAEIIANRPGLVWLTITGHGARGETAGWVGFGDDCGVAGGLTAAMIDAGGEAGFVGDAIADPLTGIAAALTAWDAWEGGRSGRYGLAMSAIVAAAIDAERDEDAAALDRSFRVWSDRRGEPFPPGLTRPIGSVRELGADRPDWSAPC